MQWLTALLAFATTMLMFAIIVSTLVEMVHRIFHLRAKGLHLMLESLYDRVIKPRLEAAATATGGAAPPSAKEFSALVMENRAANTAAGVPQGRFKSFLRWFVDWTVVTDLPVEVFAQKLADSKILGAADSVTDEVVKDIAQKYEAFGTEFSAYFESRARVFSVIIAFLVAWFFYVHPYTLAVTYFKNPELAQQIADRATDVSEENAELSAALEKARADGQSEATTEALKKAIDDLKTEIVKASAQNEQLRAVGVPVGWGDELQACTALGSENCTVEFLAIDIPIPSFVNGFWLVIGGLLVGLGAPFWAQAVSSLMASRDISQRIAAIVTPERTVVKAGPTLEGTVSPAVVAPPPAVAAFRVAERARPPK